MASYFTGTEPPLDLRPVCKFKFVRCGPGENNQSALSFSVEAWWPDEVREHLFPISEIEIFDVLQQFLKKFQIFQKFSGEYPIPGYRPFATLCLHG